jgi:hypothetical protein
MLRSSKMSFGRRTFELLEGVAAVAGAGHRVPLVLQDLRHRVANVVVVVDDEDGHVAHGAPAPLTVDHWTVRSHGSSTVKVVPAPGVLRT